MVKHCKLYEHSHIGDRINKLWCIHTVRYYAAVKTNEEDLCELICSSFQEIFLNEKSKCKNAYICVTSFYIKKKRK